MKRGWMAVVLTVGMLFAGVVGALAADSEDVAAAVAETGVYVESGTSASESRAGELVASLRDEGENISMVVLADEPVGGATTFADAVFNRIGQGVILVVAPESIGTSGASEEFGDIEIDEALDAAIEGESDGEVLEIFTASLLGTPVEAAPEPVSADQAPVAAETESGGIGGFLVFLILIGLAVVGFFWWRSRQNKTRGPKLHPKLAQAKEAVQKQIDDVANDLIDMEDEVRVADNDQVDAFYDGAGAIYNDVTEEYAAANTPEAILELSNQLDQAIWQLDSAEAILDGKPLPDKPVPKRLPTPETMPQPAPSSGSVLPPRPQYDQPSYDRRSSRRSRPAGPGLMDILMGVAGAMMAGRRRGPTRSRSGGGGLLGGLGGLGTTSGSRRVPPTQFPSVPSRSGSSSSRPRRGSTGRIRSGRKRRRR